MSVRRDATQVEAAFGEFLFQDFLQCLGQRRAPIALEGQKAANDRDRGFGRMGSIGVRNGQTCAVQSADRRDLVLCIANVLSIDRLFGLEDRIDALGWNDSLTLVGEYEGRILTIE